jgi:hypothetical protein
LLFFAPLLFGSDIYRQQVTTFQRLREWEYAWNRTPYRSAVVPLIIAWTFLLSDLRRRWACRDQDLSYQDQQGQANQRITGIGKQRFDNIWNANILFLWCIWSGNAENSVVGFRPALFRIFTLFFKKVLFHWCPPSTKLEPSGDRGNKIIIVVAQDDQNVTRSCQRGQNLNCCYQNWPKFNQIVSGRTKLGLWLIKFRPVFLSGQSWAWLMAAGHQAFWFLFFHYMS